LPATLPDTILLDDLDLGVVETLCGVGGAKGAGCDGSSSAGSANEFFLLSSSAFCSSVLAAVARTTLLVFDPPPEIAPVVVRADLLIAPVSLCGVCSGPVAVEDAAARDILCWAGFAKGAGFSITGGVSNMGGGSESEAAVEAVVVCFALLAALVTPLTALAATIGLCVVFWVVRSDGERRIACAPSTERLVSVAGGRDPGAGPLCSSCDIGDIGDIGDKPEPEDMLMRVGREDIESVVIRMRPEAPDDGAESIGDKPP